MWANDGKAHLYMDIVWIVNGTKSCFPCAVFGDKASAVEWIRKNRISGTLTEYAVGISAFDWAVSRGYKPKKEITPEIMARFSPPGEHFHYEDGEELRS